MTMKAKVRYNKKTNTVYMFDGIVYWKALESLCKAQGCPLNISGRPVFNIEARDVQVIDNRNWLSRIGLNSNIIRSGREL